MLKHNKMMVEITLKAILCNNKQELNLSATDAVYEMHENNFLRSLTDLKSPALLHLSLIHI